MLEFYFPPIVTLKCVWLKRKLELEKKWFKWLKIISRSQKAVLYGSIINQTLNNCHFSRSKSTVFTVSSSEFSINFVIFPFQQTFSSFCHQLKKHQSTKAYIKRDRTMFSLPSLRKSSTLIKPVLANQHSNSVRPVFNQSQDSGSSSPSFLKPSFGGSGSSEKKNGEELLLLLLRSISSGVLIVGSSLGFCYLSHYSQGVLQWIKAGHSWLPII